MSLEINKHTADLLRFDVLLKNCDSLRQLLEQKHTELLTKYSDIYAKPHTLSVYWNIVKGFEKNPDDSVTELPLQKETKELVRNYWIDNTPKPIILHLAFHDGDHHHYTSNKKDFDREIQQTVDHIAEHYFSFLSEDFKPDAKEYVRNMLMQSEHTYPPVLYEIMTDTENGKPQITLHAPLYDSPSRKEFLKAVEKCSDVFFGLSDHILENMRIENDALEEKRKCGKTPKADQQRFDALRDKRRADIYTISEQEEKEYQDARLQFSCKDIWRRSAGNQKKGKWTMERDLLLKRILLRQSRTEPDRFTLLEFQYHLLQNWLSEHDIHLPEPSYTPSDTEELIISITTEFVPKSLDEDETLLEIIALKLIDLQKRVKYDWGDLYYVES